MSSGKWKPEPPLTETQKKAVAMYYDRESIQDIATACGVHRSTIWRWSRLRNFKKEYNRIDRNWRRKIERREAKKAIAEEEYWAEQVRITEAKLQEETAKLRGKPGKSWQKAYNDYQKAMCKGLSMTDLLKLMKKVKW